MCRECRIKNGYKPKNKGFHTAQRKKCSLCGEVKVISPDRHWVKEG